MSEMVCKYCGYEGSSNIASYSCSNSPTGKHVIMRPHDGDYICQYCGYKGSSSIASYSCSNSPTGHHVIM